MLMDKVPGGSVKLGDKIFAVTNRGEIVPTLVSEIALVDELACSDTPDTINDAMVRVKGLLSYPYPLHRTILSARAAAVSVLEKQLQDESLTVCEHTLAQSRYDQYTASQADEAILSELQQENRFFVTATGWCAPEEFPSDYYQPGTAVFVADLEQWRLVDGFVTKVHFNPSFEGVPFGYCCGDMVHVLHEQLYTDKHTALRYMSAKFAEALPGTLNPDRVPVVAQGRQKTTAERLAALMMTEMRSKLL